MHSINQVLYGWFLGIWLAFTLHYCLQEPIKKLYNSEVEVWKLALLNSAAFASALAIQVILYVIVNSWVEINPVWTKNIKDKCPSKYLTGGFQHKSLIEYAYIGFGFGAFYGVLLARQFFPQLSDTYVPCTRKNCGYRLLRTLMDVGFYGVLALIFRFVIVKGLKLKNVYLVLFIEMIPWTAIGILVMSVNYNIAARMGIIETKEQVEHATVKIAE